MKKTVKNIEAMTPLEIVDYVESKGISELKNLSRIAKGRVHTRSTHKKVAAPIAP